MKGPFPAMIVRTIALSVFVISLSGCQETQPPSSIPATPAESPLHVPPTTESLALPATQILPTLESLPAWWLIPTPSSQAPLEVIVTPNVPYTSERLLDVYRPATTGDWPVVVVFHGGLDSKSTVSDLARAIAEQGTVVFAPTWHADPPRLSSSIRVGAEDAACAIRFARAHASTYGAHDNRVVVVGQSAGALVGALMMLAGDEFHGDCLTEQGSALPDAFVGLDGIYDPIPFIPEEVLRAAPTDSLSIDPYTYVDRGPRREGVRFLLFVGSYETAQRHSQAFRDALQAAGYDVLLVQVPGVDHVGMARPLPQTVDAIAHLLRP